MTDNSPPLRIGCYNTRSWQGAHTLWMRHHFLSHFDVLFATETWFSRFSEIQQIPFLLAHSPPEPAFPRRHGVAVFISPRLKSSSYVISSGIDFVHISVSGLRILGLYSAPSETHDFVSERLANMGHPHVVLGDLNFDSSLINSSRKNAAQVPRRDVFLDWTKRLDLKLIDSPLLFDNLSPSSPSSPFTGKHLDQAWVSSLLLPLAPSLLRSSSHFFNADHPFISLHFHLDPLTQLLPTLINVPAHSADPPSRIRINTNNLKKPLRLSLLRNTFAAFAPTLTHLLDLALSSSDRSSTIVILNVIDSLLRNRLRLPRFPESSCSSRH